MEDTSPIEQYDESVGLVPLKPSDEEANESLAADILEGQRKLEKMQRWGRIFYGENFERYTRVHEMEQYLPAFRDFYISEVTADPKVAIFALITEFNKRIAPAIFYPRPQQYQNWRGKWDTEILNKRGIMVDARKIRQVVKTRSEAGLHAPDESALEEASRHLGGELVNDALDMLHRDQETPELYEADELTKRRGYVLNVFNFVTKAVQGKEALKIKKNADARETAGFLMDIMRQGTAGKVTPETISLMRESVSPVMPNT